MDTVTWEICHLSRSILYGSFCSYSPYFFFSFYYSAEAFPIPGLCTKQDIVLVFNVTAKYLQGPGLYIQKRYAGSGVQIQTHWNVDV